MCEERASMTTSLVKLSYIFTNQITVARRRERFNSRRFWLDRSRWSGFHANLFHGGRSPTRNSIHWSRHRRCGFPSCLKKIIRFVFTHWWWMGHLSIVERRWGVSVLFWESVGNANDDVLAHQSFLWLRWDGPNYYREPIILPWLHSTGWKATLFPVVSFAPSVQRHFVCYTKII